MNTEEIIKLQELGIKSLDEKTAMIIANVVGTLK